jgi:predicted NAD/FAD-binding protein
MRIAVIGSGISGLGASYLLKDNADVHLFENDSRFGGHSHTVEADFGGVMVPVDTGFIVYNPLNYPNLVRLFSHLGVATQDTDMSFAVSLDGGRREYEGSIRGLLAQPANLTQPRYWSMLAELVRFYRSAPRTAYDGPANESLGAFVTRQGYSEAFVADHLLPMGAAIWSCTSGMMLDFPVRSYMRFLENHKLLNFVDRPQWRTVTGGSREYVGRIVKALGPNVHKSTHITGLRRAQGGVVLSIAGQGDVWFDKVILAAHADQSLALITDASDLESEILSSFRFQENRAVLHSDPVLMPKRRSAWGSWNYVTGTDHDGGLCLTYWMNRLQSIDQAYPLYETLNPHIEPDPSLVHGEFSYDHPVFDERAILAQARLPEIQGHDNLFFAGAWTGYGFHEDGLKSAIAIARSLNIEIPWQSDVAAYPMQDEEEREIA